MVQMPCPEQAAWGGVLKRRLLRIYGARLLRSAWAQQILLPPALAYTRWVYWRLARGIARQIGDYRLSGMDVVAVIGVDASPSCGVTRTLDINRAVRGLARVDVGTVTVEDVDAAVRGSVNRGSGLFVTALQHQLEQQQRRWRLRHGPPRRMLGGEEVPMAWLAHDLIGELDGRPSPVPAALRRTAASFSAAQVRLPGARR
jgi:hypothetical protein